MQKKRHFDVFCLLGGVAIFCAEAPAYAQAAPAAEVYIPKIIPRLVGTAAQQTMGAADLSSDRLDHIRCEDADDCQIDIQVSIHPHDKKKRACLMNVSPVIYVHRAQKHKTLTWKLVVDGPSPPAFQFVRGKEIEIADNIDDVGVAPSKKQVFAYKSDDPQGKSVTHVILSKIPKAFAYTINIEYPDPSDATKKIACAPLDPIIVNRD